ncbi:MAG TPA: CYTH domain-containing protein [Solirubrobacter sp.]|nr:CYTH domain-containing protein [Solirubrobacter sp.]
MTGVEVERKFLLPAPPPRLEAYPSKRLEQGYLAIDPAGAEVRIRRKDGETLLTVKTGIGLIRGEEEFAIDRERFERLWPLTAGRQVVKTRYFVPLEGGLTAEVDVYDGDLDGLVTGEIEFPDAQTALAFVAPEWLGRDVTDDPRYANRTLAVEGIPD